MESICSLLSTEHGPEIKTTFSELPTLTSPIATEEAARRNSCEASLYGFRTGMTASTPGMAARGFSRATAADLRLQAELADTRDNASYLSLRGVRICDNDHGLRRETRMPPREANCKPRCKVVTLPGVRAQS